MARQIHASFTSKHLYRVYLSSDMAKNAARMMNNSKKAVFPPFSLFPVILALFHVIWCWWRTKFSPVSLHNTFTEYTKAFISHRNAARQMYNVKKAVDSSFFCFWSLLCHFASFDACATSCATSCGTPNSRHFFVFHLSTPQRDTFRQYVCSKMQF